MSLDVYLRIHGASVQQGSGIFIREDGQTKEISRAEWDERFPDREPVAVVRDSGETDAVFTANITHNLSRMARAAGIFQHLWCPEEIGLARASELIEPLRDALAALQSDPARFAPLNPVNGWGTYDQFVSFVADYLGACERFPDALVEVSR
jgi:hypothetical protein